MTKFFVLYRMPIAGLEAWMQIDPEKRKADEDAMKVSWNAWMASHTAQIKETAGAGKTKLVTSDGVSDSKNDIMLYSMVEAESHEAAAKLFENHPHLQIPGATIEVMTINVLPGAAA